MDTKRFLMRPAAIILSAGLLLSSTALADRGPGLEVLGRAVRAAGKAASSGSTRGSATPILSAIAGASRHSSRGSATPFLSALAGASRSTRGSSTPFLSALAGSSSHGRTFKAPSSGQLNALGDILGSLSGALNEGNPDYSRHGHSGDFWRNGYYPGDYGYGHDRSPEHDYASAYRDVGIASAVANMIGVIVSSTANGPVAYQPAPVVRYQQPAPVVRYEQPAPVVQQPAGHYERRQVPVREGYYEQYEVRVPESVDPRTNEVIVGHNEIHRRWVPEVYGYQDVWVPGP